MIKFDWNVYHYDYHKRSRNLDVVAQGRVESEKFFPVFFEEKKERILKPLSKTKPLCTPYFAYSEVFWSTIIHHYFDSHAPIYHLAICHHIDDDFPNKYPQGTIVDSITGKEENLINLYSIFREYPDSLVNISKYTNLCGVFYDYEKILSSKFIKENKEFGEELARQLLYSILRVDQNYHYENVSFIEQDGIIQKMAPPIDYEFSTMFLYLDKFLLNENYFDSALKDIKGVTNEEEDIFSSLRREAFPTLSKTLDCIVENYKEVSLEFLEQLKVMIKDLRKEPIILENHHYVTPFNSDNYKTGILRYKKNLEELAKKNEEATIQYQPDILEVSQFVYSEVITFSSALEEALEKRMMKTKVRE